MRLNRHDWISLAVLALIAALTFFGDQIQHMMFAQDITDPSAYASAQKRWGGIAMVGMMRCALPAPNCLPGINPSNWTRQVGYASPNCDQTFTVIGTGFNTWTAAFAAADMNPYKPSGPYKGTITLQIQSFSPTPLTGITAWVDGAQLGTTQVPPTGTMSGVFSFPIDTTMLTEDFHAVCAQATNAQGIGKMLTGALFIVNQTTGTSGVNWLPGSVSPRVQLASFSGNSTPGSTLAASYLGATGQDFVGINGSMMPDGVPDWHIQIEGLRGAPTHITVTAAATGEWDWPLTGTFWYCFPQINGQTGDLFIEPFNTPSAFTVKVTYADGTTDSATAPVSTSVARFR